MKIVDINRWAFSPQGGVFGSLEAQEGSVLLFNCRVLEPPWRNNKAAVSCIPAGTYILAFDTFKGKYPNYKLLDVPGHTDVEMHIGNSLVDTEGCILLGAQYRIDEQYGKFWITESTTTFKAFMKAMGGDKTAVLSIRENVISTTQHW